MDKDTRGKFLREVKIWKYIGLAAPYVALFVFSILSFTDLEIWVEYFSFVVIALFFCFSVAWWWWALDRFNKICQMLDTSEQNIKNLRKQIKTARSKGFNNYH